MPDVKLTGCRPEPLAHYLKALAVLRLVGEQADPDARGWWEDDIFVLRSKLDRDAMVAFFADAYCPTPVLSPWGGTGGFFFREEKQKDKSGKNIKTGVRNEPTAATRLIDEFANSTSDRLFDLRLAISSCRDLVEAMGLVAAPEEETKATFLRRLRSEWPDRGLAWLDAALVVAPGSDDGTIGYASLLGTGGNDGNLGFSKAFLEGLKSTVPLTDRLEAAAVLRSRANLEDSLFAKPTPLLQSEAPAAGQFDPTRFGQVNGSSAGDGARTANPWDVVLMIEGTCVLGSAATRQLGATEGELSSPFTVRMSPAGTGSVAASDQMDKKKTAREIWLPIWKTPASLPSIQLTFNEGRISRSAGAGPGRRGKVAAARSGLDVAQSLTGLGIARGISSFRRFAMLPRYGDLHFAVPMGELHVRTRSGGNPLAAIDGWLDSLVRAAQEKNAPFSVKQSRGLVEAAVIAASAGRAGAMGDLLVCLANAEQTASGARGALGPVPTLAASEFVSDLYSDSPEFRLAAVLAANGWRGRFVPVVARPRLQWDPDPKPRFVTFSARTLESNLVETVHREQIEHAMNLVEAPTGWSRRPLRTARLDDIAAFLRRETDDDRLYELAHAMSLLDAPVIDTNHRPTGSSPGAAYALYALVLDRRPKSSDLIMPATPEIIPLLRAGRVGDAARRAMHRLRACGLVPGVEQVPDNRADGPRLAAALAFPLNAADKATLLRSVGVPEPDDAPESDLTLANHDPVETA